MKMSQSFQEGLFEFQDLNSQKVIEDCNFLEYEKFLDFCSGAGGKILCLASLRKGIAFELNQGKIFQHHRKLQVADKSQG